MTKTNH